MSNNTGFNYVFNTNNDYAGLTTELPFIIRKEFKGQKLKYPEIALLILCVLIGKTQKVNQRNNSGEIKYYESSTRDLARQAGVAQTTIQRAIDWLSKNKWLEIAKGIDNPQKMRYILNVEKINDAIAQHLYN